jgi:hypothetical protein
MITALTHSPELLELVSPEHVRVVSRSDDGVTGVRRMAAAQVEVVKSKLMTLGEVMRTSGLRQQPLFPAAE